MKQHHTGNNEPMSKYQIHTLNNVELYRFNSNLGAPDTFGDNASNKRQLTVILNSEYKKLVRENKGTIKDYYDEASGEDIFTIKPRTNWDSFPIVDDKANPVNINTYLPAEFDVGNGIKEIGPGSVVNLRVSFPPNPNNKSKNLVCLHGVQFVSLKPPTVGSGGDGGGSGGFGAVESDVPEFAYEEDLGDSEY